MRRHEFTRRRVVGFSRRDRRYVLDCGHLARASVVGGRREGVTCPQCARAWLDVHLDAMPPRLRALPSWARLIALAYPETEQPPPIGERVPVQLPLINEPPRDVAA